MEKVRIAVFNMLQSLLCCANSELPSNSRWLDLYAGTGSVGLEAMSRGCGVSHFVEMDPWTVREVLMKNIEKTGMKENTVVHTMRAENFLLNAKVMSGQGDGSTSREQLLPFQSIGNADSSSTVIKERVTVAGEGAGLPFLRTAYAGGAFDFVSICPPYKLVDYPSLLDSIATSPLIMPSTYVIVEHAKEDTNAIPEELGPLTKLRERKYGRTYIVIYGPRNT